VTDNDYLVFDTSGTQTFKGVIAGSGTVNQNGAGTTILTATNTYSSGFTTINAGTLQLGAGGTSGSIVGNVQDEHGALAFEPLEYANVRGTISGNGAVTQIGAGTTILTGANTYSGGTTFSAGTLQLGAGGATGSIVGNVTNNRAVSDQSVSYPQAVK
jgi:autotransporter-associated beta strand protein